MTPADILHIRLHNQPLAANNFQTPAALVSWMGVMQSQEMISSKWAIGIRIPGATEKMVNKAIDKGEIIRTHVLRPTWHYVAPEDLHWMLHLSAPQIKAAMKFRHKFLQLTDPIVKKSKKIITKALSSGEHLTRKELTAILKKEKIDAQNEKGGHLLLCAEIEGIICSGAQRGKEITYALLEQRVLNGKTYPREEALGKLAIRFFTGHGPATVRDFIWWSGLSVTEGKMALELVKNDLESATINEQEYWFAQNLSIPSSKKSSGYLLPAFDEYIIAYADRSLVVDESKKKSIFENGLFRNVILVNGKAIGLWKRVIKKDKTVLETQFFKPPTQAAIALARKGAKAYGKFVGQKVEVSL